MINCITTKRIVPYTLCLNLFLYSICSGHEHLSQQHPCTEHTILDKNTLPCNFDEEILEIDLDDLSSLEDATEESSSITYKMQLLKEALYLKQLEAQEHIKNHQTLYKACAAIAFLGGVSAYVYKLLKKNT
ncbi:MAG: hypothetical protein US69_C0002G0062 [candidate division TM6 bacterium GW2011_GWF2_38_10]|nr:MAG: hypothetical protein US69_C0002G0062 [candidate division TM6 bacterium GW2011_GWF2_38_10]